MTAAGELEPSEGGGRASRDPGASEELARSSIGRNILALLASQVTTWVLATLLAIVQPRFLGPGAQGELRLALALWTIAQVVIGLGTSMFLTLEIARDRQRGLALVGPVLVLRTFAFLGASFVLGLYLVFADSDGQFVAIMAVFGVAVFFSTMSEALMAVFIGLERMSVLARAGITARVVGTVVTIVVLLVGGDALSVVSVSAGANLLGLLVLLSAFRSVATMTIRGWRSQWRLIVAASSAFLLAGVILTTYQQVDTVIMSLLVEDDALGWYAAAETLSGSLVFLPVIVMGSLFPVIGRLFHDDPAQIAPLIRRASSALVMVVVPISLGTVIVAIPLAPLLYGEAFAEAGQVLAVFGVVLFFSFGTTVFGTIALATERQRFWNTIMIGAIMLTIPLDVILVPWADRAFGNGAIGGAVAFVVTEGVLFAIGLWKMAPYLVERVFLWRLVRVVMAGAFMFALAWPLRVQPLVLPIVVGVVSYVVALVVLRVPKEKDWKELRGLVSRGNAPIA